MLKMTIDNEEVVSKNDFTIKEEMLSASSTILNNVYPKTWEQNKDYTSRFYYPKDYAKLNLQKFSVEPEEAGTTIQINGSATLNDVDTTKESRVTKLLGQTSQTGTPTPSSPIPINVVSGDNEIIVGGKNILPITLDKLKELNTNGSWSGNVWTKNGMTFTINDDLSVICNGTPSANTYLDLTGSITLGAGTRTFSGTPSSGSGSTYRMQLVGDSSVYDNGSTNTFTLSSTTTYTKARIFIANGQSVSNIVFKPMLEEGSSFTTYEPYIGNTYPIYLRGENIFNSTWESGSIGGSGSNLTDSKSIRTTRNSINANTTYIVNVDTTSFINEFWVYYYNNDTFVSRASLGSGNQKEFTTPSGVNYVRLRLTATSDISTSIVENQIIYAKNTRLELCKIGDYQDYLYKDNGSWYLHKEIGKVVLNGSESWQNAGTNPQKWSLSKSDYKYVEENICLSNYFKSTTNGAVGIMTDNQIKFRYHTDQAKWLYICDNTFSAVADFKTWLSTHNTIVYYVLATPTNTEITDATLLEQLEALQST